jgi:hypothetical protein
MVGQIPAVAGRPNDGGIENLSAGLDEDVVDRVADRLAECETAGDRWTAPPGGRLYMPLSRA